MPSSGVTQGCVYIVEDDESVRESIAAVVRSADLAPHAFCDGEAFLAHVQEADPSIPSAAIVDFRLPQRDGLTTLKAVRELGYTRPVLIVTAYGDVDTAVQCMRAGAVDYITKPVDPPALLNQLRRHIETGHADWQAQGHLRKLKERLASLTGREREVLDAIIDGKGSKRVAFELGISEKTIEKHRANLRQKLGVETTAELAHIVGLLQSASPDANR